MADLRRETQRFATAIWTAKIALFLVGVVSALLLARVAVPYSLGLLASILPRIWISFRGWLVPPYLFITVHLIIVTIWKLSDKKQHRQQHRPEQEKSPDSPLLLKPIDLEPSLLRKPSPESWHGIAPSLAVSGEITSESDPASPIHFSKIRDSSPERSDTSCLTTESDEMSTVSSRLEIKKSVKPSLKSTKPPEKVAVEEEEEVLDSVAENDTIDATWKAIMEKRGTSESSMESGRVEVMRGGEGSVVGHDEWNQRFEAFIKKTNDQIRLQEMVNRGNYY